LLWIATRERDRRRSGVGCGLARLAGLLVEDHRVGAGAERLGGGGAAGGRGRGNDAARRKGGDWWTYGRLLGTTPLLLLLLQLLCLLLHLLCLQAGKLLLLLLLQLLLLSLMLLSQLLLRRQLLLLLLLLTAGSHHAHGRLLLVRQLHAVRRWWPTPLRVLHGPLRIQQFLLLLLLLLLHDTHVVFLVLEAGLLLHCDPGAVLRGKGLLLICRKSNELFIVDGIHHGLLLLLLLHLVVHHELLLLLLHLVLQSCLRLLLLLVLLIELHKGRVGYATVSRLGGQHLLYVLYGHGIGHVVLALPLLSRLHPSTGTWTRTGTRSWSEGRGRATGGTGARTGGMALRSCLWRDL